MRKLRSELISESRSKGVATKVAEKNFPQKDFILQDFSPRLKNIDKAIAKILSVKQYENMVIHYSLLRSFLD